MWFEKVSKRFTKAKCTEDAYAQVLLSSWYLEPPRTFSTNIIAKIARCIQFFGWVRGGSTIPNLLYQEKQGTIELTELLMH